MKYYNFSVEKVVKWKQQEKMLCLKEKQNC